MKTIEFDTKAPADRILRALEDYALHLKGIRLRDCFLNIRISQTLPAALYLQPFGHTSGKWCFGLTIEGAVNEGLEFIRNLKPLEEISS